MPDDYQMTDGDYNRKYGGCVCRIKQPKAGIAPLGVIHSTKNGDDGNPEAFIVETVKLSSNYDDIWSSERLKFTELDLELLPVGCINTDRAVFIIRTTRPSNHSKYKVIHPVECLEVVDPLKALRNAIGLRSANKIRDFGVLKAWGENQYLNPAEALELMNTGEYLARAFSSRFYFAMSPVNQDIMLMYMDNVAGKVTNGAIELKGWAARFKELLEGYGLQII